MSEAAASHKTSSSMATSQPLLQSRRALYVGGLADTVNEATLRAALIPFGPIKSLDIPMDYTKGIHKGFAFCEYDYDDDAAEAMYNMDGAELHGRVLTVNVAQPDKLRLGSSKPVWSQDDWFKEQSGMKEAEEKKAKEKVAEEDASALKEKSPAVASSG